MKKCVLVLLTFVPFIVGHIVNRSISIPVIGSIVFYVLPLLTTAFWFYLGRQYARSTWKTIPALLIGKIGSAFRNSAKLHRKNLYDCFECYFVCIYDRSFLDRLYLRKENKK